MAGTRKGIATAALAVGLTLGTSGIADAVTVGVRGISPNVWSPKVSGSIRARSCAGSP
jgi:hypothetical protein